MKELLHHIRQTFQGKRLIENKQKYKLLGYGAAFIHLFFALIMFTLHENFLTAYNVIVVLLYLFFAAVLAERELYSFFCYMTIAEIELHSILATVILGWEWGFMSYTTGFIPGIFYMNNTIPKAKRKKAAPYVCSLLISTIYLATNARMYLYKPLHSFTTNSIFSTTLHFFNAVIGLAILVIFSTLFALEVKYTNDFLTRENSRLGEIANYDPLTHVLNRRTMPQIIDEAIKQFLPGEKCFCLLMLDIDYFKKINDTFGHDEGDVILTGLSDVLRSTVREGDSICRWGGEEFLILIHGDLSEGVAAAERIRLAASEKVFTVRNNSFHINVTIGVAEYQASMSMRDLITAADKKLYTGKKNGRNQVVS